MLVLASYISIHCSILRIITENRVRIEKKTLTTNPVHSTTLLYQHIVKHKIVNKEKNPEKRKGSNPNILKRNQCALQSFIIYGIKYHLKKQCHI